MKRKNNMAEFNLIKNFTLFNFGGDKKIEVASGKDSEGVMILSSKLDANAIKQSNNLTNRLRKKIKQFSKP